MKNQFELVTASFNQFGPVSKTSEKQPVSTKRKNQLQPGSKTRKNQFELVNNKEEPSLI